ncbi:hypothetical protein B0H16DRAFT_1734674 [Mycena metata]|uniref:Uncharacterized protein n=1 Tax=Mycena metata TaxID=1033252 RepID=A0AAD7MQJ3_9AGAR|nr:hypothetical protein B0H16DRAFT_1734674 [Mycena metata]
MPSLLGQLFCCFVRVRSRDAQHIIPPDTRMPQADPIPTERTALIPPNSPTAIRNVVEDQTLGGRLDTIVRSKEERMVNVRKHSLNQRARSISVEPVRSRPQWELARPARSSSRRPRARHSPPHSVASTSASTSTAASLGEVQSPNTYADNKSEFSVEEEDEDEDEEPSASTPGDMHGIALNW